MKTFQEPTVYLISRPSLNTEGINKFFADENLSWKTGAGNGHYDPAAPEPPTDAQPSDGELLPEFAGRICYVSFGAKQGRNNNHDYLQHIIKQGHGSVLEHANYTFLVTNASRGFTHEMVRHRAGFAFSQESTHYIDYTAETGKINVPKKVSEFPSIEKQLVGASEHIFGLYAQMYKEMRAAGVDKKTACGTLRGLLPNGMESKIVFTANARAIRHFIETRATQYNVAEIKNVAVQVYDIMKAEAPALMMGLSKNVVDGDAYITTEYKKV
jgi:thymidylate synthase (FAD)